MSADTQVLGSDELRRLMANRELLIEPLLDSRQVDPIGVDLRLDCFFREFVRTERHSISLSDRTPTLLRELQPFTGRFYLQPLEFVLAQSLEYIALPNNVLAFLNGRSSLGRRGLIVHATANVVDPGWCGHLVFELANLGSMPIELVPLMRIARLILFQTREVEPYRGKFKGQLRINEPAPDELVKKLDQQRDT